MDIVARMRQVGFRKWYERQLIDSHLAFVTCLLAGITVAACLEAVDLGGHPGRSALLLSVIFLAGLVGWHSWRRYIRVLERAERYGLRSTCESCRAYARFEILASGHAAQGPYADPASEALPCPWLRVRCRRCQNVWRLPD